MPHQKYLRQRRTNQATPSYENGVDLIFTFTVFNQLLAAALIKSWEPYGRSALVVNSAPKPFSNDRAEVINFCANDHSIFTRFVIYHSIARKLRKLRSQKKIVSVSAPHPHNLLSNSLILTPGNFSVNIYEDGAGNYCASNVEGRLKEKSKRKRIIGPLVGYRYLDYSGHISGLDERLMDNGYFISPENIYRPERFLKLHRIDLDLPEEDAISGFENAALILDQDIEEVLEEQVADKLRAKMYNLANSLGTTILVKSHPASSKILEYHGYKAEPIILDAKEAAEILALRYRPRYVVSYFSSALKNIKQLLPETQCIEIGTKELDDRFDTHLSEVFRIFDIELA